MVLVIINHTGDVFAYEEEDPFYTGEEYPVKAFRDENGEAVIDPENPDYRSWPDGGVWPEEIFNLDTFSRADEWNKYIEIYLPAKGRAIYKSL